MNNPLQVILVDDEYLAIEDLLSMIDWNSAGFEIVGTARSGKQALKILSEKPVDLVVTDISMPGMDGITLIEEAKKMNSNLVFLLLTAYAEVDYMKKAFQLGVEDYLIKDEINSRILSEKLKKICTKMLSHHVEAYSLLQKQFREYFNTSTTDFPSSLSAYRNRKFYYCIITPDILHPLIDDPAADRSITALSIIQSAMPFIEEFSLQSIQQFCSYIAFNNKIVLLLEIGSYSSTLQIINTIRQYGKALLQSLSQTLSYSYSFFYCQFSMNLEEIHTDYFRKQMPLRGRYFFKANQILALDSPSLSVSNIKIDFKEETLIRIYQDNPTELPVFLKKELQQITEGKNYAGLFAFLQTCFSFLEHKQNDLLSKMNYENCKDLPSISAFLIKQIQLISEKGMSALSHDSRLAISYVAEQYSNPELSLQEIADNIGLSVTHLSRIFKAETGETVGDYITAYRMQIACQLLKETNQKIYEISEATGYSSPQYFSQVFVRQFGVKPIDYRKRN